MSDPFPATGVIVVTWNSARHLKACISAVQTALEKSPGSVVVVVDNGSSDGTLALAASFGGNIRVVETGRNLGYAAGINAAVNHIANADGVQPVCGYLILNPDAQVAPACVSELWAGIANHSAGIAIPKLLDEKRSLRFSMRRTPTITRSLGMAIGGQKMGFVPSLGEVVVSRGAYERGQYCEWATGAVLLVTRECMERVGRWDEGFFLYSEETDFMLRGAAAGYRTYYTPDAEAVHLGGDLHKSPRLYQLMIVNKVREYRKRNGVLATALFRGTLTLNEVLRCHSRIHRAGAKALLGLGGRVSSSDYLE